MFILYQNAFANNTSENIDAFVNCWSSFYNETPGDINSHNVPNQECICSLSDEHEHGRHADPKSDIRLDAQYETRMHDKQNHWKKQFL